MKEEETRITLEEVMAENKLLRRQLFAATAGRPYLEGSEEPLLRRLHTAGVDIPGNISSRAFDGERFCQPCDAVVMRICGYKRLAAPSTSDVLAIRGLPITKDIALLVNASRGSLLSLLRHLILGFYRGAHDETPLEELIKWHWEHYAALVKAATSHRGVPAFDDGAPSVP